MAMCTVQADSYKGWLTYSELTGAPAHGVTLLPVGYFGENSQMVIVLTVWQKYGGTCQCIYITVCLVNMIM